MIDPFRLAVAIVPLAAYLLLLGILNYRRRPFLTSGGCDLTALGLAVSGLLFVGPMELLRPEAATRTFGNYIWLFLLLFYWLWLLLTVLLARPRLVVYNVRVEELHPVLAEAAARIDPTARWAGNHLSMPGIGVQLHLDSLDIMRNVSLVSSGGRQSIDGWRQLARELGPALPKMRVRSNPRAIGFLAASIVLLALSVAHLLIHQDAMLQAMNDVFAF
ncbi:MAG TPA: hypothetical protein VHU84_06990 [Lacipirellulaceae bacterium]|jgi:hypothetical protein|nr:hypothetical protein [Lacipirellulaceae bacterium]